jgi:Flp pilus assembly protein TadG
VEFALALPLFAVLLFAVVDTGLAFGGFITFRNGVDSGARLAAVNETAASCSGNANPMACTILNRIGSSVGVGNVQIQIVLPSGGSAGNGNTVEVCAQAKLRSTTGITPFISGRTVHATSTVHLEKDAGYSDYGSGICGG